ncbi:helix-turn-helix domain-containing protein [Streptomyces sp. NPDC088760]|uniref:helix-turn-helix domain-containing protein n=1 Tax=Streptomyces sp. NPDC088760 TaxID=3365890 RepID=UPI0037F59F82
MHKGKWITGSARKELTETFVKEYREGRSIRAIAEAHGRSYGFVHRVLTEARVPLRARGGDSRTGTAGQSSGTSADGMAPRLPALGQ